MGEINDQRTQQPEDERKATQRRTFTRWMNVFLQQRDPPLEVHDLFTDVQDGRMLLALLEELSGCKLLYRFRASSHRIFRLNNISKALAFLDDRHVKLLGIDACGVADGIPSVVLNLLWNMILFFQVKEVTGGLQRHLSSSLSSLSTSSYPSSGDLSPQPNDIGSYSCSTLPSKGRRAAKEQKYHGKAIKTLLQWVQRCTSKFGVEVRDFGKSWRSGLAFLAMIKSINPALVDLRETLSREPRENIQLAFTIAHNSLDIPPLLEPEDVSGPSPDERSIITYVSMFLGHCSLTDEDHTTYIDVPYIPNFGSLESVSFGETLADDPEAQALLQGLEKSSEQQLWKRWSRRSSGSPQATSSPFGKKRSKCRSALQPPSPLDTGVVSQDIRSWLEKASVDQTGYSKPRDESELSLSSEEGIYCLSALDSDEEDAYSYILDLNKEVFQPYNQLKRQVPRVEEETEEEMFLNGQPAECSNNLGVCETLNGGGCKHQEDSLAGNVESEATAQSAVHTTFDRDKNESRSREMANREAVFDMEPEEDGRRTEEHEDESAVRRQRSFDDGDYCEEERKKKEKTEIARLVKRGCDEREAKNTKLSEGASWKTEVEEEAERRPLEKWGQMSEKRDKEEENVTTFEKGNDGKSGKEKEKDNIKAVYEVRGAGATTVNTTGENDGKDNALKLEDVGLTCKDEDKKVMNSKDFEALRTAEEKDWGVKMRRRKLTDKKVTTKMDQPGKTAPRNDNNGGVHIHGGDCWTPACRASSRSFRKRGFILQSSPASCDITPLELEVLLVLWIFLYCSFILPQMNF